MDGPYRSAPRGDDVEAPRDRGIVGDVVAQFADPLAFYRELVQNAIDAGSATVEVELRHDPASAAMRVTVRDRGEGMDRDLVENSLLVLFRSTKDQDPTKIGKFGIGFSSVLAPGPRIVVVDTVRDGRRLTLHLHPDLSYQLFEGGPATRNGTAVELELPVEPGAVAGLVQRSHAALVRWCRHAAVPIRFIARAADGQSRELRIDTPLALDDALLEVREVSSDGATTAVVGLLAGGAAYGGFFNRGLMLHETSSPLAGQVAFKVQSSRLGHTLSRDDVRRDRAFDDVMELVRELAGQQLPRAVARALAAAAETGDRARWVAVFEAADAAHLALEDDEWVVPLLAPVGEATAIAATALPRRRAWAEVRRTPVTDALAEVGQAVVAVLSPGLAGRVAKSCGRTLIDAHAALTLVTAVPPTEAERAMLDELMGLLGQVARAPAAILMAELDGALAHRPWITGGRDHAVIEVDAQRWLLDLEVGTSNPFRRLRRRTMVLNARDPVTQAARRGAQRDPLAAASVLARLVLLQLGQLDIETSTALLEATLAGLGLVRDR